MPTVYYAINPFGTGDQKTGSPNMTVSSNVMTLDVAQTGNIGVGYVITANSVSYYITSVTSSTVFVVSNVQGGNVSDVGTSTAVTSISAIWADISTAEASYLGASFLNTTDLVTNQYSVYFACYYDQDDNTPDGSKATIDGATSNATYNLTIFTPQGGTESINDQRYAGGSTLDTNKFYMSRDDQMMSLRDDYASAVGIQYDKTGTNTFRVILEAQTTGNLYDSCILRVDVTAGENYALGDTGATGLEYRNCVCYGEGAVSGAPYGSWGYGTDTLYNYCTIKGFDHGASSAGGNTKTYKNCAIFDNNDDWDGTTNLAATYCATDDNDLSGTGNFAIHGTYTDLFTDYANEDFSLKTYTSTGALIEAGNPITGITTDIVGTTRDGTNPDVGAFEFVSAVGSQDAFATDVASFSDSAINQLGTNQTGGDSLVLIDPAQGQFDTNQFGSDLLNLNDLSDNQRDTTQFATDKLLLNDIVSIIKNALAVSTDDVQLTDATAKTATYEAIVTDSAQFEDSVKAVWDAVAVATDNFVTVDVARELSAQIIGKMRVEVRSKQPSIDVTEKKSTVTIIFKQSRIDVEEC